jgi:hypothetical protein
MKIIPSLQFKKRLPSLASAAEATTKHSIAHSMKTVPFNLIGCLSLGDHPIKKCPHARLQVSDSDKYEALEWTFMIMLEARKQIVVSGYVAR